MKQRTRTKTLVLVNVEKSNPVGPPLGKNDAESKENAQRSKIMAEIRWKAYRVLVDLTISTDIEETARGIIGAGAESVSIWEELNGVDVGLVTGKCLHSFTSPNIPQFGKSVASAGDEDVILVSGVDADAHDVSKMVGELGNFGPGLNIPQHAGHVPRGCQNAAVVDETAAREVSGVTGKLASDSGWAFTRREIVNRTDIVEATASHIIPAGGIGASHHP